MVFLASGFMAKNGHRVPYEFQVFSQVYPFMFTSLAILCLIEYKAGLLYGFENQPIPRRFKYSLVAMALYIVFMSILLPSLTIDRSISNTGCKAMNFIVQTSFLIAMSGLSAYLTVKLLKYFRLHNLETP